MIELKAKLQAIWNKIPNANCQGKCQESCRLVTCTPVEMKLIDLWQIEHGKPYKPFTTAEIKNAPCPYLVGGKCEIREVRPTICRLWGVTEDMKCPFGCKPDRVLSVKEKEDILKEVSDVEWVKKVYEDEDIIELEIGGD